MRYNVKDMVLPGKQVKFQRYHNGNLWYSTSCGFEFPVPIGDTGAAEFMAVDRAMLFMRWIRKHVALLETGES